MIKLSLLSKNIKRARVVSGMSQKVLAKKLRVSDKTISAYETGRAIPPTPTVIQIAKLTKMSVSELMGVEKSLDRVDISNRLKKIEDQLSGTKDKEKITERVKVDIFVGVVLIDKTNRIYLIKEEDKYRISKGRWNLPGGSVDNGESLIEAVIRETKEETGCDSKVQSLVGCYKCKKGDNSWVYTVFKSTVTGSSNGIVDPGIRHGKWFTKEEFLKMEKSRMVHPDMKIVYKTAIEGQGLKTKSVKYIDYDVQ